ncbi:MAG: T9SS type A sorting domain-containing protein [Bacteroidia bacterium]|nr:T9SS type A sorting domain-containing protein [Bacteroidia bacterium]
MKKINTYLLAFLLTLATIQVKAQMTSDVVSIGAGYTNQAFYSMSNGELSNITHTDWDIAFQIRGFAASILINSKNNVRLWNAGKAISQWSSMTVADTTSILSDPAYELFNSDTSWDYGAFNRTNDTSNQFDLGWGTYDFITHVISGDSVYFIKIGSTDYRKLKIESLTSGVYYFRYANLDGSNEIVATLTKSAFTGKFFAYYSLVNNLSIDREPVYNTWDLTFCQYLTLTPYTYKVTGVLSNDSVVVAKAYPVDPATPTPGTLPFNEEINTIGFDWKSYDFSTNVWTIADSTVYFVRDRQGNTWKVVFTGFDGSSTGNFYFDKGPATPTGLLENSGIRTFGIYPNPASQWVRLMLETEQSAPASIAIVDISGRQVREINTSLRSGLQSLELDVANLPSGIYQVVVRQGSELQVTRMVKE